jgi:polyhydroxyalkanoate synthesis regulator phasin
MMKQKLITSLPLALLFFTGMQAMILPKHRRHHNHCRQPQESPQPSGAVQQPPQAGPQAPQPPAVPPQPAVGREAMLEQARKLGMERAAARAKEAPGGPIVPAIPRALAVPPEVQQAQQEKLNRRRAQAAQREIKQLRLLSTIGNLQQQVDTDGNTIARLQADLTIARDHAAPEAQKLINDLLNQNERDDNLIIKELTKRINNLSQQLAEADQPDLVKGLLEQIDILNNNIHDIQAQHNGLRQANENEIAEENSNS